MCTSSFRNVCANCPAEQAEYCRYTFGDYYECKSSGGKGCNYPIVPDAGMMAKLRLAIAKKEAEAAGVTLSAQPKEKWIVMHMGAIYPTLAATKAEAINNVRFRLYGPVPLAKLTPFEARPQDLRTIHTANGKDGRSLAIGREEMMKRLARMG